MARTSTLCTGPLYHAAPLALPVAGAPISTGVPIVIHGQWIR